MKLEKGTVICFESLSPLNLIIKIFSSEEIGHCGIMINDTEIIEAVANGVEIHTIDEIKKRRGNAIACVLNEAARERFNEVKFDAYINSIKGIKYDYKQMVVLVINKLFHIAKNGEGFKKLFCSELVAHALEVSNVINPLNASMQTPQDIMDLGIYKQRFDLKKLVIK